MPSTPSPLTQARIKVTRLVDDHWQSRQPGHDGLPMPMIPFIPKDRLSVEVLEFYLRRLRETQRERLNGGEKLRRPMAEGHDPIMAQVAALLADFYRWQSEHPDKVKWPD